MGASTLYRFRIELSDVDRGVYETLDLRVAMHPSETPQFLMTRVLAYALNFEEGLEFSPGGLSDTDQPAIRRVESGGAYAAWIEVGSPAARKLHKGAKAARKVAVYTYKDPALLLRELEAEKVHRLDEIGIFAFDPKFLGALAETLARDNTWTLIHTEGSLTVGIGAETIQGEATRVK
jgi:uncharacterized protein YaeQ